MRVPIVQAIEADDFTRCGGDVYARGHIRTLAREVGLDPAELVAQYDAEHGGRPQPTAPAALFEAEKIRPERRKPNWTAVMVAAIVAVIGFVGFTLVQGEGQKSKPPAAEETPSSQPSVPPSESPDPTETPPADPKPSDSAIAAAPADKVTVQLTAKREVWISAEDHNGKLVHEGVLKKGESKTLTDDERLDLVLGNAASVKLYVNGKEVEDVGEDGQVQRVSYTRGDPEAG